MKNQHKAEQRKAEHAASVSASSSVPAVEPAAPMEVVQRRTSGQYTRCKTRVLDHTMKRRAIRKKVRKPNKIMKKQIKKASKRSKMVRAMHKIRRGSGRTFQAAKTHGQRALFKHRADRINMNATVAHSLFVIESQTLHHLPDRITQRFKCSARRTHHVRAKPLMHVVAGDIMSDSPDCKGITTKHRRSAIVHTEKFGSTKSRHLVHFQRHRTYFLRASSSNAPLRLTHAAPCCMSRRREYPNCKSTPRGQNRSSTVRKCTVRDGVLDIGV